METRRGKHLIPIIGAIGLMALVSFVVRDQEDTSPVEWMPDRSTYNGKPSGCKAFYLFLEKIGLQVERWQKRADLLPAGTVLFMVIDPKYPFVKSEIRGLERWVRGGGTLVILDDRENHLYRAFALRISKGESRVASLVGPSEPTLYARKVQSILIDRGARFRSFPSAGVVHFADAHGAVMVTLKEGAGKVIGLSTPSLASNLRIGHHDHMNLLLNILLAHGASGKLLIDEYHHGYTSSDTLVRYLFEGWEGIILFQGILLGLAVLYTRSRRFGRPRRFIREERRSSLEYIHSMANLFQISEAQGPALNALIGWVKKDLFRDLGLPRQAGMEELAYSLAERGFQDPEAVTGMLTRYERKAHKANLEPGELQQMAKRLYRLKKRVKDRGGNVG